MDKEIEVKPTPPFARKGTKTGSPVEKPIFETVEHFEDVSAVHPGGTKVKVTLRLQLNYKPSRSTSGPYWLDLRVGGVHIPYYGISEEKAIEAACRFLLEHLDGLTPPHH